MQKFTVSLCQLFREGDPIDDDVERLELALGTDLIIHDQRPDAIAAFRRRDFETMNQPALATVHQDQGTWYVLLEPTDDTRPSALLTRFENVNDRHGDGRWCWVSWNNETLVVITNNDDDAMIYVRLNDGRMFAVATHMAAMEEPEWREVVDRNNRGDALAEVA